MFALIRQDGTVQATSPQAFPSGRQVRVTGVVPGAPFGAWPTVPAEAAEVAAPYVLSDLRALREEQNDKAQADLLAPTDWLYIRRADIAEPVPPAIQAYRDAVRAAHADREAWILDGARTIDDLVMMAGCPAWPEG